MIKQLRIVHHLVQNGCLIVVKSCTPNTSGAKVKLIHRLHGLFIQEILFTCLLAKHFVLKESHQLWVRDAQHRAHHKTLHFCVIVEGFPMSGDLVLKLRLEGV